MRVRVANLPAVPTGEFADVVLAVTEGSLRSSVARGENGGRELHHTGVVRALRIVGTATAQGFTETLDVAVASGWMRANTRAVVFVQERRSRRVLAAGAVRLAVPD